MECHLENHKSQCTVLLLIRHAVNDWVNKNKLAGWTVGVHLNDEGWRQAEMLAERLGPVPIAAVYSSPLERAMETAEPLARAKGLTVEVRDRLGETQYGEWTGQSLEELSKTELWKVVQHYPSGVYFPGGETLREMQTRMVNELEDIGRSHPGQIVAVVSHADPLKAVVAHYAGMHLDMFQRLVISPASVTIIAIGPMGPLLIEFNNTGSLEHLAKQAQPKEVPAEAPRNGHAPDDDARKDQSNA